MENEMKKLIDLAKRNMKSCPWTDEQRDEGYLMEVVSETEELQEAFMRKDLKWAEEEMGDLLWDILTLAYIMEREGKIKAKGIVAAAHRKISRRKPWLLTGRKVSRDEAVLIWKETKRKEKRSHYAKDNKL
ncbi:MazG nucleotide pyrophosphohydrolase domain protein [uncultured archaeon]|nr:MazG nucleotide pyrophosphohydrolase domain protein [uncultured archaeon]